VAACWLRVGARAGTRADLLCERIMSPHGMPLVTWCRVLSRCARPELHRSGVGAWCTWVGSGKVNIDIHMV
jgi:hypothetical protein